MKKMKKTFVVLVSALLFCLTFSAFSGCNKDKYDITYAAWNLSTEAINNIERRMVKAFEDKTGYKVKIEEAISIPAYGDSIKNLATKGQLPDVFLIQNLNYGLSNEFVADISEYAEADEEWDDIPEALRNAVYYGSGIYAVPFALHMRGYFINVELFDDNRVDELDIFPEYDDFYAAVEAFYNKRTSGLLGLNTDDTILEWYPASLNDDLGWFTWDGENYHLDSDEFMAAMEKVKEIFTHQLTYNAMDPTMRSSLYSGIDSDVALWDANKLAIRQGSTFEIPDMLEKGNFSIKFIGVPGGRVPIVGDYLAISPVSKKTDVAYAFAKWMSFDPEGIAKRMELDTTGKEFNTLPVTTNAATIEAYFQKNTAVSGLREVFEHIDAGIMEGVKVVPGYGMSRWDAYTGVSVNTEITNAKIGQLLDLCKDGTLNYGDYKNSLNTLANLQYANAVSEYAARYN